MMATDLKAELAKPYLPTSQWTIQQRVFNAHLFHYLRLVEYARSMGYDSHTTDRIVDCIPDWMVQCGPALTYMALNIAKTAGAGAPTAYTGGIIKNFTTPGRPTDWANANPDEPFYGYFNNALTA